MDHKNSETPREIEPVVWEGSDEHDDANLHDVCTHLVWSVHKINNEMLLASLSFMSRVFPCNWWLSHSRSESRSAPLDEDHTLNLTSPLSNAHSDEYAPHEPPSPLRWGERLHVGAGIAGWFAFSLASLFIAKHVLHVHKINEGVFALWQFSASVLFGVLFTKVLRVRALAKLDHGQLRRIVPLSVAFLIKEVLKYASLARVSVNLVNTIRSLGPLFNVLLEALFFAHLPQRRVLWALAPIVAGVVLTSFDELQSASVGVDLFAAVLGFASAVLYTAISNGQNIYSKILFGKERIDPVSLQIYLSAISLVIMAPGSALQFLHHALVSDLPKRHWFAPSLHVASIMSLVGFVNFVSSQLAFNTLNRISPLSYSVANTFKRVCIACIAIFYLDERLSLVNGAGIAVSIGGVFIYERVSRAYKLSRMYQRACTSSLHGESHAGTSSPSPRPQHRHTGSEERLDMLELRASQEPKPQGPRLARVASSPIAKPPKYPDRSPSTRLEVGLGSPVMKMPNGGSHTHLLSARQ